MLVLKRIIYKLARNLSIDISKKSFEKKMLNEVRSKIEPSQFNRST